MSKSIDQIRAELAKQQAASQGNSNRRTGASDVFPFWNAEKDSTSVVRFLPDGNSDNVYFWRERQIISIPFKTVEGHPELRDVVVEVPCVKMYNKKNVCPIIQDTAPLWKGTPSDVEIARLYYPKKTFIYQGFVVSSGVDEEEVPENPIRRFLVGKQLHKIIESALIDPEMEANPVDLEFGTDFRIIKGQNGAFADYSTSKFARNSRPLTADEANAIETHGLFDLGQFLPRQPDAEMMEVIKEMYVESRQPVSEFRLEWAKYYTPKGAKLNIGGSTVSSASHAPVQRSVVDDEEEVPFEVSVPAQTASAPKAQATSSADDILAKLQARINGGA